MVGAGEGALAGAANKRHGNSGIAHAANAAVVWNVLDGRLFDDACVHAKVPPHTRSGTCVVIKQHPELLCNACGIVGVNVLATLFPLLVLFFLLLLFLLLGELMTAVAAVAAVAAAAIGNHVFCDGDK